MIWIREGISNWNYHIPDSPVELFADFYFFSILPNGVDTPDIGFNFSFEEAQHKCISYAKELMEDFVELNLCNEFDEVDRVNSSTQGLSKKGKEFVALYNEWYRGSKIKRVDFTNHFDGILSKESYELIGAYNKVKGVQKKIGLSDKDLSTLFADFFEDNSTIENYGGKKWSRIARVWNSTRAISSSDTKKCIIAVDHIVDIEHNTGLLLSNSLVMGPYKHAIHRFLNWKKKATSVKEFYKEVSASLKPIVAYVSKNVFGEPIK